MKITGLKIHNFGILKNVNIELNPNKSVAIIGENGTGKSTILEAVSLAYTGKMARAGYKIQDYIGPYADTFKIQIKHDDGSSLTRIPSGTTIKLNDGREFKKKSDVEKILPFDPDILFNIAYLKQFEISDFFSPDKKNIIDNMVSLIIDISKVNSYYKNFTKEFGVIDERLKRLEHVNNSEHDVNEMELLKEEIVQLKSQYDSNKKIDISTLKSYKMILEKKIRLEETIKEAKEDITKFGSDLENQKAINYTYEELDQMLDAYKKHDDAMHNMDNYAHLIDFCKGLIKYRNELTRFFILKQQKLDNIDAEKIEYIKTMNSDFNSYMTTSAYTTIEEVDKYKEFIRAYNLSNDILDDIKEFKALKDLIKNEALDYAYNCIQKEDHFDITTSPDELKEICEKLIKKYDEAYNKASTIFDDIRENFKIIDEPTYQKMRSIKTIYDTKQKNIENIENELKNIEIEIQKIPYQNINDIDNDINKFNVLNNLEDQIRTKITLYKHIKEILIKQEAEKEEFNKLSSYKSNIDIIRNVLKIIPIQSRKILFSSLEDIINNDFRRYFSFSELGRINIDFEKLNVTYAEGRPISGLSGAQRNILFMMLRYALLKRLGSNVNILLADEPTIALDDARILELKKFLSMLGQNIQMFLITHTNKICDPNTFDVYNSSNNFKLEG